MIAVLYLCSDKADTYVAEEILKSEGVRYTIVVDRMVALKLSNGGVNPASGWCVHFPKLNITARSWKDIYLKLGKLGLLRAI